MKWRNLLKNKCPKCNEEFYSSQDDVRGYVQCGCGFSISEEKMLKITAEMTIQNIKKRNGERKETNN